MIKEKKITKLKSNKKEMLQEAEDSTLVQGHKCGFSAPFSFRQINQSFKR